MVGDGMRGRGYLLPAAVCVLLCADGLFAQASDSARVAAQREELETIRQLEGEIPEVNGTAWDYGGYYRFSFTKFTDPIKRRQVYDQDFRIWGSLSVGNVHQFYVRGRVDIIDWRTGDSPTGKDDDVDGMNLDQGWYRLRVAQLAQKWGAKKWPVDIDVKLGRQYLEVGHGIVFSQIFDAAIFEVSNFYFDAQLFGGQNTASNHNLDETAPKYWHDHRRFFGGQVTLRNVVQRVEPYVYGLWVDDRNPYDGGPAGQGFGYNPRYFGAGARVNPFANLRLWTEFIAEGGKSHAAGSTRRENIDAHAFIAGAEYDFKDWPLRPRLEAEYGLGSGDSDRQSPANTLFGNKPFTDDQGFLAYGYHDTGVAFAPRLANLSVLRATASFHPLEFIECMRNLEMGASFYWFEKAKRAGGVTDFSATLPHKNLGTELDLFANWRITSDLLWTIRWGKFDLGRAYPNSGDSREYILTTLTYNF